jgi:hypothetical protein
MKMMQLCQVIIMNWFIIILVMIYENVSYTGTGCLNGGTCVGESYVCLSTNCWISNHLCMTSSLSTCIDIVVGIITTKLYSNLIRKTCSCIFWRTYCIITFINNYVDHIQYQELLKNFLYIIATMWLSMYIHAICSESN